MPIRAFLVPTFLAAVLFAGVVATQAASPAIKSHHLFNLPDGITEADIAAAIRDANSAIAESGYPEAGYRFWKVTGDQAGRHAYLWEGNWPSQAAYDSIHNHPAYVAAGDRNQPVFGLISEIHLYNRYIEIPIDN